MRFVTDFLWRSPLGLRINAQDTAGVTQTEDWVKIRGDQLAARDGSYDVRITAELWETHFIDHVSLMVVDHPDDTDVFVDERFARSAPALTTHAMRKPRPVAQAWDESGRDVTDLVESAGRPLSRRRSRLASIQGIAADHFVEVDLGREIPADTRLWLVASGWIYPTDSSINVAIGQGQRVQPRGLSLEAQDRSGRWVVVSPDLGFPAGKNKTILIDLQQVTAAGVAHARRLRLRTNLEVYWDRLAVADGVERAQLSTSRLQPERAELRYRGFSQTDYSNRRQPEIPVYDRIANVTQRWRDLVGYYTRFGDVRELLGGVDDRYVIMNAGDELKLSFRAPAPPASGLDARFRPGRRRLGKGRRLQHDVFEDRPAAAASRSAGLRVVSRRRARRRSGLSPPSAGLGDLPHAVRDARRIPQWVEMNQISSGSASCPAMVSSRAASAPGRGAAGRVGGRAGGVSSR